MNLRPSSLPLLAACPCFESGETEWTEAGTNRHAFLYKLLQQGAEFAPETMSDEDFQSAQWAADYIQTWRTKDAPLHCECKMSVLLPDFTELEGTPDVVCAADLFDLKSRPRDYRAQMAAYVLMMFEADPTLTIVTVHLLFTETRSVEKFTLTKEQAEENVMDVVTATRSGLYDPRACDYCGWCKHKLTCSALVGPAKEVAIGYNDKAPEINITDWHPSQMETAEQIALGLTICRKILKKWCDSMEFHAMEAVIKKGMQLPGYSLKQTVPKQFCKDVAQAFGLSGLPQEKFLQCCDLRLNTSKKYPDRIGVVDLYKEFLALPKATAKKELMAKLEPVMSRGTPGNKLVADGEQEDEE
jgi:hypothetical protein